MFNFPEECKVVWLNSTAANAVSCDVISSKNANKIWFVILHTGANDTDLTLSLYEATDVAAGTTAAITATCPIWYMVPTTSLDTLTRGTDAYSVTIDPATQSTYCGIIEWDPAKHTEGYDCVYLADSGGNASNTCVILAVIDTKYKQSTPPSAIID